jgi:hypothetical protein
MSADAPDMSAGDFSSYTFQSFEVGIEREG